MRNISLALLLSFAASAQAAEVVDMVGRRVQAPDHIERVFGAAPPLNVLLHSLAPDKMIGLSFPIPAEGQRYFPPRLRGLPVVGGIFGMGQQMNPEAVLAMQPDIALAWKSPFIDQARIEAAFAKIGLPVVFIQLDTLADWGLVPREGLRERFRAEMASRLAALLARALSRPLLQIVGAVQRVASGAQEEVALPLGRGDEIGLLARAVRDMQQQIRSQFMRLQLKQDELDSLASRDSLTGLLNRRVFLDRLEHALAQVRRSHQPLALLFIDLDRFKAINDLHGHAAGDAVLQTLAQRLLALVREADTVARIGGDEFVILLDPAGPQLDAGVVADKVRELLAQPIPFGAQQLQSGASIGIGRYPDDGTTVGELLSAADRAMYAVKQVALQGGPAQPAAAAEPG